MERIYFAPMEGITGYLFRNAYEAAFGGCIDAYFAPFIANGVKKGVAGKDLRELLPENNDKIRLVPQLLTNKEDDFANTASALFSMGYERINLNLGCPSGTVVSKGRGAGMLADTDKLDRFLDSAFSFCEKKGMELSLKTRLGLTEEEEFAPLLSIYEKYPVQELIIHLRLRSDYYKLPVRPGWFAYAYKNSRLMLVYNGDIQSLEDVKKVYDSYPDIKAVMIGRGLLKRPWMLERGGLDQAGKCKLWKFHDLLYEAYQKEMSGQRNVLFKMKELWTYLGDSFSSESEDEQREIGKALKEIRKSRYLLDYEAALRVLRKGL